MLDNHALYDVSDVFAAVNRGFQFLVNVFPPNHIHGFCRVALRDFSIDEVRFALEHGFESVTLGNSRLRTETAGLSAVMMSQLARRM